MSTPHHRGALRSWRLAAFVAIVAGSGLAVSSASAGGYSISLVTANPNTITGEAFNVSTGGGNREFTSVAVSCTVGADEVYGTVLTVEVPPKGTGTSQTIYPPASSCKADLVKLMQIGKSRVLATVYFTVAP